MDPERERWLQFARSEYNTIVTAVDAERSRMNAEIAHLNSQIEEVSARVELQDLGMIFSGEHPVAKSVDYKTAVDEAKARRKALIKQKQAVFANQSWAIGGDIAAGRKLTEEMSKLMLRAYNNEVDALIKSINATNGESKVTSLRKKKDQIKKLGSRMGLEIALEYHDLAIYELRQTSLWQAAKLVEKEADRAHKEQLREQKKVADEIAREQAKLDKELKQFQQAFAAIEANPDTTEEDLAALRIQIEEVERAQGDVTLRAANTRAGHVYVISNPGSFGETVVKIGMTRRLVPMDRVIELGDASVPFRFSLHALIFSDDAVALETALHQKFADRRINKINMRREFFRVHPTEVKDALVEFNAHMVEFDESPVNEEWAASQ